LRSFGGLAWRSVRARRLRALLTAAGIVLGVGLMLGVLLLTTTINSTFRDLFDSVYGTADLVVAPEAEPGTLRERELRRVERLAGVESAQGTLQDVFVRVEGRPRLPAPAPPEEPQAAPAEVPGGAAPTTSVPAEPPEPEVATTPEEVSTADEDAAEINVAGVDPDDPDTAGITYGDGRAVRAGREVELEENFAGDQGLEVGDRVRLATPRGIERFDLVGVFRFARTFGFGGEGFGRIPLGTARRVMDQPNGFDEITVVVSDGRAVADVRRRAAREVSRGVEVTTPESRSDDVEEQLRALTVLLLFVAAMGLFVGAFLIFNSFQVTVVQRRREIGMLRTLGAGRAQVTRGILREAALLGLVGTALGVALGVGLAIALVHLMGEIGFPVGGLSISPVAIAVACTAGVVVTIVGALHPAWRAGRTSPLRAVLGVADERRPPSRRRALLGALLTVAGLAGVFVLASSEETPPLVAAAGMGGVVLIFLGVALAAPIAIVPIVRVLSWPLRRGAPIQGRLASDSARANPGRTALTATGLMIGLALVTAFGALSSSFLGAITDEFDRSFARDYTVQPSGFAPGQGPQQTFSPELGRRLERLQEAGVVTRERLFYSSRLVRGADALAFGFQPREYGQVDEATYGGGLSEEEVLPLVARGQVVLGDALAEDERLEVGDELTLRGPSDRRRVRVAGRVETAIFGGQTVSMSLATMREVYGVTRDSSLAITASSPAARPALEVRIERIIGRDFPQLQLLSNDELKGEIESRLDEQFGFFNALLLVAVVVSLFGVINTLSMNVLERTREIGVLRALGSSRWQVRLTIGQEGVLLCAVGALLGLAVGLALGYVFVRGVATIVPTVSYVPPVGTVALVAAAGVVLGLVASVLPARRAARMNVVRALSYE
jgi:putative ABC transport system permease protein